MIDKLLQELFKDLLGMSDSLTSSCLNSIGFLLSECAPCSRELARFQFQTGFLSFSLDISLGASLEIMASWKKPGIDFRYGPSVKTICC